jgi:hypothetical protein
MRASSEELRRFHPQRRSTRILEILTAGMAKASRGRGRLNGHFYAKSACLDFQLRAQLFFSGSFCAGRYPILRQPLKASSERSATIGAAEAE